MKRMLSVFVGGAVIIAVLAGCAGPSASAKKNLAWWNDFTGEKVTSARTIYPSGEVPRTLIKMESGTGRIY